MLTPVDASLPVAHVQPDSDANTYYSLFANKIEASWNVTNGLVIRLAADDPVFRVHAPLRALARFVPAGQSIDAGGSLMNEDSLVLKTWPTDFLKLSSEWNGVVPSLIILGNVDKNSIRSQAANLIAETPIVLDPAVIPTTVDGYMSGTQHLLIKSGSVVGEAGIDANTSTLPRRVTIRMYDTEGAELHPVYFLGLLGDLAGTDLTTHPLLAHFDFLAVTSPSLTGSLLCFEDPSNLGAYRTVDYGLFSTLTPHIQIVVSDASEAAALQVSIADGGGISHDISNLLAYDAANGTVQGGIPESATRLGMNVISIDRKSVV